MQIPIFSIGSKWPATSDFEYVHQVDKGIELNFLAELKQAFKKNKTEWTKEHMYFTVTGRSEIAYHKARGFSEKVLWENDYMVIG